MKQCVYIVRYGLRECPLVEEIGPFDMDISSEGVAHAKCTATKLCESKHENEAPISGIYSSPFYRSVHTSSILASSLGCPVKIEEGLTEWLTTALVGKDNHQPKNAKELYECGFKTIDLSYSSVNALGSSDVAPNFVESEDMLMKRSATTIERILENVEDGGSIVIVSHAPVNQAVTLALEGNGDPYKGKLWYLGGVTKFSRKPLDCFACFSPHAPRWICDYYGDTSHMPDEYREGQQGWTLPSLS